MAPVFSRQDFEKYSNVKCLENPCSGDRVVPCGRKDMTKLIVAFRSFAKPPNKTEFQLQMTVVSGGDRSFSKCCYTKGLPSADGRTQSSLSQVKSL